jgi:hypothetical protein
MTQEAMKQALEALEDVGVLTDREWQAVHKNKANELRQAIRERALYEVQRLGQEIEQEPVDYEKLAALGWQAIECGICGGGAMGYPQRTWAGLTKDEVDSWNLPDHPTVFEFAQFIEARLKQKNGFAEEKNT